MRKLLGAGLGLALLFGCAATGVAQKEAQKEAQAQPAGCQTTSSKALKEEMLANKIHVVADLEGEPLDALKKWLEPYTQKRPVPQEADRAVIFLNPEKTLAMITWFKGDCLLAYNMGPWQPLKEFLGVPI